MEEEDPSIYSAEVRGRKFHQCKLRSRVDILGCEEEPKKVTSECDDAKTKCLPPFSRPGSSNFCGDRDPVAIREREISRVLQDN